MAFETILLGLANWTAEYYLPFMVLCYLAVATIGDSALLLLTIFSISVHMPVYVVFIAAFLGKLTGDVIWFKMAKVIMPFIKKRKILYRGYLHVETLIEKLFERNSIIALSIIKLLYGTRIIATIYLAHNKMKLKEFVRTDIIASIFWLVVFGGIGVLAGYGFKYITQVVQNLLLGISLLIIFFAIIFVARKILTEWLEKIK